MAKVSFLKLNSISAILVYLMAMSVALADDLQGLKWSGDLRLRSVRAKEQDDDLRYQEQFRLRFGFQLGINDNTNLITRFASNTNAGKSATSANQTFGDNSEPGMARRGIGIDWAYIDWKPIDNLKIWAGRTANPFWAPNKGTTLFDSDLAFEGLSARWEQSGEHHKIFATLSGNVINEAYSSAGAANGKDQTDPGLVGVQLGYQKKSEKYQWTSHLANYQYLNVQNHDIAQLASGAPLDPAIYRNGLLRYKGNSVYLDGSVNRLENQYTLLAVGSEFKNSCEWGDTTIFVEYLQNYAIGRHNKAYEVGASFKHSRLQYTVARIVKEMDSVLGVYTDTDNNGGGADNRGFRLAASAELAKAAQLTLTHYFGQRGVDTSLHDFALTHLDFVWSF